MSLNKWKQKLFEILHGFDQHGMHSGFLWRTSKGFMGGFSGTQWKQSLRDFNQERMCGLNLCRAEGRERPGTLQLSMCGSSKNIKDEKYWTSIICQVSWWVLGVHRGEGHVSAGVCNLKWNKGKYFSLKIRSALLQNCRSFPRVWERQWYWY